MGKVHEGIDARLREFLLAQHIYFVGTAPSAADGHVNVSPKGMAGTFAVLGEHRVAYLDYLGSGVETIAHLVDNGRIVLMFCAFTGPPNIVRLHGTGVATLPGDAGFADLLAAFPEPRTHGLRSIIDVTVTRVSDSCGYSVPRFDYVEDRDLLVRWAGNKDDEQLAAYAEQKNRHSIDRLPALPSMVR
ncbi:MAG TPA: pyridoxamine 5'-phosphate oxidase family protein [Micromonosporaceae bacterium]|nr:pyridoxamine 5'-phosphate oxidase family protein [Micromonosporaceae bacterium]